MTPHTLDELVARSAPPSIADDPGVAVQLRGVVSRSRSVAKASRWRRRALSIAVPVLVAPVAVFGLTGGMDERLVPDSTIPIFYTTDTGRTVECSIDFYNPEVLYVETDTHVEDFVNAQDWTGVGQRLYNLAVERLAANDPATWQPNEWPTGVINQPTPEQRDQQAWVLAVDVLIVEPISANTPASNSWGMSTDCTPVKLQ